MLRSSWKSVAFGVGLASIAAASCASGEGQCRYNSDCLGAYCHEGACKKDCVDSTLDCPRGYTCSLTAQCVPADRDGTPGEKPQADAGPEGPDGNAPDGGPGPGPDSGTTTVNRALLDACTNDSQCSSGLCKPYYTGGPSRCTKSCSSNADCMQNARCIVLGGQSVCVGNDVGRDCNLATDCSFACLTAQRYCTASCTTASDCPNGYGCMPVGTPAQRVCVKAAAPCGPGDTGACIASSACDQTGLVSSCTLACSSAADCPQRAQGLAPWYCDGVCRRPADVYGPLGNGEPAEYACNASSTVISICNDAQHMNFGAFTVPNPPAVSCAAATTTPGAAGDVCVDSCRYSGGCTFGHACTALGGVGGQRIGLCLPSLGNGEVGTSCTTDGDCFFGYCNRNTSKCSRDCTVDGLCPTGSTCVAGTAPNVEGRVFKRCE